MKGLAGKYLRAIIILVCILFLSDCDTKKDENTPTTDRYSCDGTISQCLKIKSGWTLDVKTTSEIIFDPSVVRLSDGRFRIYGNDASQGIRRVISLISTDGGITYSPEPGYRIIGDVGHDAFSPVIVALPNGKFRMYLTDQRTYVGAYGAPAFISAISDDGLNFTWEDGKRLTYSVTDEPDGIRNQNIVYLPNGQYRMYYSTKGKVLSAISADGLSFVRESGVRYDPGTICPAYDGGVNPSPNPKVYIDKNGIFHMFSAGSSCDDIDHNNESIGIFEGTSQDGLTFVFSEAAVVQGYYIKSMYKGNPADPSVNAEDPMLVLTAAGLRMYFACGSTVGSPSDVRYFSVCNPNIR